MTLTLSFQKGLKELTRRGIYLDPQDAIRGSLKDTFEKHNINPFNEEETSGE